VVSELEISVPIARLALGDDDDVSVDIGQDDSQNGTNQASQYVRFKIQPLPDALTKAVADVGAPGVPDIKDRALAEGLMALAQSGYNLNRVLIAYDARSAAPAGRVLRMDVKGDGLRPADQDIVLTIAGPPPDQPQQPRDLPDELLAIEGIGEKYAEKLVVAGITSTDQLAERAASAEDRQALAEATGIGEKLLERWVNMIGLMRLTGIGPEFAELLEGAGISTLQLLAKQEPAELHDRLTAFNEKTPKVRRLPSRNRLAEWIKAAAAAEAGQPD
jgi:predicted flap endonuclease-1-like 5' DNA nuclease